MKYIILTFLMLVCQFLKAQFFVYTVPTGINANNFYILDNNDRTFKDKILLSLITLDDKGDTVKLFAKRLTSKGFGLIYKDFLKIDCRLVIDNVQTIPKDLFKKYNYKFKSNYKYYYGKLSFVYL